MLGINSTNYRSKTFEGTKKVSNTPIVNQSSDPQTINKALLALAAIGLATLTSCSKDSCLYPEEPVLAKERANLAPAKQVSTPMSVGKQADMILKTLGLINDSASVENIKSIYTKDNQEQRHWMKATNISDNMIYGEGMSLLPNDSITKIYTFVAKNSDGNGLNIKKIFKDGSTENLNYILNNDNSVTEFEVLDNNFKLEKSVYRRIDNNKIERVFANGTTEIYSDTDKDYPYPRPIAFDAGTADTESER